MPVVLSILETNRLLQPKNGALAQHIAVEPTVPKPILHIANIPRWANAYHERTGRWPKQNSGPVPEPIDTT